MRVCVPPHLRPMHLPPTDPAGTPLAEYTAATMEGILAGHEAVAHGFSVNPSRASREQLEGMFKGMLFAM